MKGLADHSDSRKERAALILGCTVQHINLMLAGYKTSGKITSSIGTKDVSQDSSSGGRQIE